MDVTRLYHDLEGYNQVFEYFLSLKNDMTRLQSELAEFEFHGINSKMQNRLFVSLEKFREAVADVERTARRNVVNSEARLNGDDD